MSEDGTPRVHPQLVDALVRHPYTLHVRELDSLLWLAFSGSEGTEVVLTDELSLQLTTRQPSSDSNDLSREQIEAALTTCGGNQQRAYRLLNLKNRDLLFRLLKKHDIDAKRFQR